MRFHFQVRTPTHVLLTEAADLDGFDAARLEAPRRVAALLNEHAGQLWRDEEWQMDVTDDDGLILFVIQISVIRSPAAPEARA